MYPRDFQLVEKKLSQDDGSWFSISAIVQVYVCTYVPCVHVARRHACCGTEICVWWQGDIYVVARRYVCGGKEICMRWQGYMYVVARRYVCGGKDICMWCWQGDMYVVARRYV